MLLWNCRGFRLKSDCKEKPQRTHKRIFNVRVAKQSILTILSLKMQTAVEALFIPRNVVRERFPQVSRDIKHNTNTPRICKLELWRYEGKKAEEKKNKQKKHTHTHTQKGKKRNQCYPADLNEQKSAWQPGSEKG